MLKSFLILLATIILTATIDSVLFAQTNFWEPTSLNSYSIGSLAINSDGHIFAGVSNFSSPSLFRSTDNGANWMVINNGLPVGKPVKDIAINSLGYIFVSAGNPYRLFISNDNGNSWTQLFDHGGGLAINSTGHIFVASWDGVYRTTDNGSNWTHVLTNVNVNVLEINSFGHIFAAGWGIYRSTDNGDNWIQINNGLTDLGITRLVINSNNVIFAGMTSCIDRTCFGYGVAYSTNNGNNWEQSSLDSIKIWSIAINSSDNLFVASSDFSNSPPYISGVLRSNDNGITWEEINSGLPNSGVQAFAVNSDGYIFAGTGNDGIFRSVQTTTSINQYESEFPNDFSLSQNYPNPFNPTTTISWQSPVGSWQTLKVYDALGREVATLVNEYKPAGRYEVEFNAIGLSSGVYFYKLQASDPSTSSGQGFTDTKKLILMR